jgi:hypothetical protein
VSALEPKLTAFDRRVLAVVSPHGEDKRRERKVGEAVSIWEIAEALDTLDLHELQCILNGFCHLGYAQSSMSVSRKRIVWWRTRRGDEALR